VYFVVNPLNATRGETNAGEIRLALSFWRVSLGKPDSGEVAEWSIAALC
jgi:hypothetical protein